MLNGRNNSILSFLIIKRTYNQVVPLTVDYLNHLCHKLNIYGKKSSTRRVILYINGGSVRNEELEIRNSGQQLNGGE